MTTEQFETVYAVSDKAVSDKESLQIAVSDKHERGAKHLEDAERLRLVFVNAWGAQ